MGRALSVLAASTILAVVPTASAQADITPSDRLSTSQFAHGTGAKRTNVSGTRGNIGVATYNMFVELTPALASRDARRLTERADVDIVGWQEASGFSSVYKDLAGRGWTTVQPGRGSELAVSWRTSKFTLVDSRSVKVANGSSSTEGENRPFPARYVLKVVLQRTGAHPDQITVLDNHIPAYIERFRINKPGTPYANLNADVARTHLRVIAAMVKASTTRYTTVTGDFNWDFVADQKTLNPAFVEGRIGEVAVSGWEAFGIEHRPITHLPSKRRIDYVFIAKNSPANFRRQRVLTSRYHSDHRPVLVRLSLN